MKMVIREELMAPSPRPSPPEKKGGEGVIRGRAFAFYYTLLKSKHGKSFWKRT
jgi:hypothetical protein